MKLPAIIIPEGCTEVLLHACCAPCSSAIVEWMLANGVRPVIFYFNPNIFPLEEYEIRKNESKRHAESLGIRWIDGDYNHEAWRCGVSGLEGQPERGLRCERCFTLRLIAAAKQAQALGIKYFTTTLASSRWKSLDQINRAGLAAEQMVNGSMVNAQCSMVNEVSFWAQNWRKGGLQERRNQLLRENNFYNQQYCGCEFSMRQAAPTKQSLREQMRETGRLYLLQKQRFSEEIVNKLQHRLIGVRMVLAYWPLPDEVDLRPLLHALISDGCTVLLPKVIDNENMELRRYTSATDLAEGAFHIQEPIGEPFTDYEQIDVALIPGMAFDAAGRRLGRGRGYYDRFLSAHPHLYKIGICFPYQRVAEVPAEEHDVVMDEVV